jgi:hypothetical protein
MAIWSGRQPPTGVCRVAVIADGVGRAASPVWGAVGGRVAEGVASRSRVGVRIGIAPGTAGEINETDTNSVIAILNSKTRTPAA